MWPNFVTHVPLRRWVYRFYASASSPSATACGACPTRFVVEMGRVSIYPSPPSLLAILVRVLVQAGTSEHLYRGFICVAKLRRRCKASFVGHDAGPFSWGNRSRRSKKARPSAWVLMRARWRPGPARKHSILTLVTDRAQDNDVSLSLLF